MFVKISKGPTVLFCLIKVWSFFVSNLINYHPIEEFKISSKGFINFIIRLLSLGATKKNGFDYGDRCCNFSADCE